MSETCRNCAFFQSKGKWAMPGKYEDFGVCNHAGAFPVLLSDTYEQKLWADFPACRYFRRRMDWEERAADTIMHQPGFEMKSYAVEGSVEASNAWIRERLSAIIRKHSEAAKTEEAFNDASGISSVARGKS